MDSITWPVAALALASITLVLSIVGNEIRRRDHSEHECCDKWLGAQGKSQGGSHSRGSER
jgi:hypothetical protein